jgi:hypothetical protein
MQKYIGVKLIEAKPMTSTEASMYLGRYIPDSVRGREGYLVVYEDGYRSWSPKLTFERDYRPIDGLTFGLAIEAVKKGYRIARKGWNERGMFVVYQKAYPQGIPCNKQTAIAWGLQEGELFRCEPYLQIKMTNGSHSMWTPSINDCLAEDWYIVEEE